MEFQEENRVLEGYKQAKETFTVIGGGEYSGPTL